MTTDFDLESAWGNFCEGTHDTAKVSKFIPESEAPQCSDIYISTKTKIAYLNQPIHLANTYWKLPIIPYHLPCEGIVKKQMKFNSISQEELDSISAQVPKDSYVDEYIITQIINPEGRIKFKDVRKISIGLCKKDIISYRGKRKGAFYNCFVLMLRILHNGTYKEIHVKVFNTGKLEIPGMQQDSMLVKVLHLLIKIMGESVVYEKKIDYIKDKCDTVLINSNFRCGFFLSREGLYEILKTKYRINCSYDSCSYPGIQSEFYYDPAIKVQTGQQPKEMNDTIVKVSFMIFRTGSALIVGKCTENVLHIIYNFLCKLLSDEYQNIFCGLNVYSMNTPPSKRKINKKTICFNL